LGGTSVSSITKTVETVRPALAGASFGKVETTYSSVGRTVEGLGSAAAMRRSYTSRSFRPSYKGSVAFKRESYAGL
jgi:hypothetical protein